MRPPLPAVAARAALNRTLRSFFEDRGFTEVETPHLVRAAGTDPYIDPVQATLHLQGAARPMWLHTSPEFAMKALLADGMSRIYQLCHVWRDGEQTALHGPEFTLLEWYREREAYGAIMDDVEAIVRAVLPTDLTIEARGYQGRVSLAEPFRRLTMREAWLEACGVDPIAGDLGVTGAKRLVPGDPAHSLILLRMQRRDANAMPPLGSTVAEDAGVQLVSDWIASLGPCE